MRVFYEQDANLLHLQNQRVAVLGYGHLGRPLAMNLRDSGLDVIIGNVDDDYAREAQKDRLSVMSLSEAVAHASIIFIALPDEILPPLYLTDIAPALKRGDLLIFASGYNIAYDLIDPPIFVHVGLIAPKTLASNLRQAYLSGGGFPAFIALRRPVPSAMDRLLALALALGALRQGALEVDFTLEVTLDLFWQQSILPMIHNVLQTAIQTLLEEGFPEEAVFTELYLSGELGEFFAQASQQGLVPTLESMALTGQYGVLTQTERFQESKIKYQMQAILEDLIDGRFARAWADEYTDGYPRLERIRERLQGSPLWSREQDILSIKGGGTV